jgi:hypothetical protein
MAEKRSVISQLSSVGEGALGRLAQNPVTHKALEGALQVKDRVEKMVGTLTELESRVSKLEKRVDALDKPKRAPAKKASTASKSTASKSS